jgi:hypothetical protein
VPWAQFCLPCKLVLEQTPRELRMPRVRDLLYRFRPAGAPGAAGGAGVPADRGAGLAVELDWLFAQLAPTDVECATIVALAEGDARARRAADVERARNLVMQARGRVLPERAAAAVRLRRLAEADISGAVAGAEREASELRARAVERTPAFVDSVVQAVRALIDVDHKLDARGGGAA